jgi:hypothetical protein
MPERFRATLRLRRFESFRKTSQKLSHQSTIVRAILFGETSLFQGTLAAIRHSSHDFFAALIGMALNGEIQYMSPSQKNVETFFSPT